MPEVCEVQEKTALKILTARPRSLVKIVVSVVHYDAVMKSIEIGETTNRMWTRCGSCQLQRTDNQMVGIFCFVVRRKLDIDREDKNWIMDRIGKYAIQVDIFVNEKCLTDDGK